MASASNVGAFLIYHRDETGTPTHLFSYQEEKATYILAAVNICRELLRHKKAREALATMAEGFKKKHPDCWYAKYTVDEWTNEDVVKRYIGVILDENFPLLFCDDGFPNPNITGCHFRRKWDRFHSKYQGICLNGSRVRDMCAAAKKAKESNDPNSTEHKQYRTFVFMFAVTIFHELGHVFITFLSLGDADTPDEKEFIPEWGGIDGTNRPESGYVLENLVFGGITAHGCDKELDDGQPGVPHLVSKIETKPAVDIGRISQETVDEFVKCNFQIPFETSGPAISNPLEGIGEGYDLTLPDDPLDPTMHPETRALIDSHILENFDFKELDDLEPSLSARPKVQIGRQSALARLVSEPGLAVKVG